MTLPLQRQRVHDAAPPGHLVTDIPGGFRLKLSQWELVFFVDLWVLLSALWLSRLATGNLDPAVAAFGVTAFAFIVSSRLTRERLGASALDDAGPILRRVSIAYAVGSTLMILMDLGHGKVLLAVAALTAPALVIGRALAYSVERTMRREGRSARAVVVGGGEIARRLVTTLVQHDEYGLDVVGVVDDDPKLSSAELGTRVLGDLPALPKLVSAHRIDVVIVAFSSSDHAGMVDVIRAAMANGAQVWVIPRFFELGYGSPDGDHLWGLPVVRLQNPARSRPEWILKRTLDFVLAGLGLLALSPVMAVIAVLVYLESGRPIFFKQTRLGLDGREFAIFKFRTMRVVEEQVTSVEWTADRLRTTRVGRFLRDTSLDELPQLFNVVRGDMSLVGPRPERPYFVQLFSELYPNYGSRHRLPAGLTGWAQIHGLRGDTSVEERAAFDNYYIENWSLARDMKILVKSLGVVSKMWR